MKIHQLSVFVENKPGQLAMPCRLLADSGISLVTLSLADTQQFGILRLVVRDWQKAKEILERAGCVVNVAEVVAVEIADRPGALAEILEALDRAGVNVEYMYAFHEKPQDKAALVFRFDDPDAALAALARSGANIVSQVDLYRQVERD
jgi:hypothetical protein